MSYSFSIKAKTKSELIKAAEAELVKVVREQPIHERDVPVAVKALKDVIDLVDEPVEGKALSVNISGSLYSIDGSPKGATLSIHVNPVQA